MGGADLAAALSVQLAKSFKPNSPLATARSLPPGTSKVAFRASLATSVTIVLRAATVMAAEYSGLAKASPRLTVAIPLFNAKAHGPTCH